MRSIYCPDEIPIHFFYFGWKKALSYIKSDYGIYDPVEVEQFNRELHENLYRMQEQFGKGKYNLSGTLTYLIPKSVKGDKNNQELIRRVRPMVQFSFRDQVAWATAMLVLSEWFDSNEEIASRIPLHQQHLRKAYRWMVPWSFNNRIKRIFQEDELDGKMKRLFIHYNHKDMYESFQWGLRNLREVRKKQFQEIREKHGEAYYGEMDIQEFYPSLNLKHVLKAIDERFKELQNTGIVSEECRVLWNDLLSDMCKFNIDFSTTLLNHKDEEAVKQLLKSIPYSVDEEKKLSLETLDHEIKKLSTFLKDSLPIGLIASGFLANCALTHFFDKKLEEYIMQKQDTIYITRYTDDMMFIASKAESVVDIMREAYNLLTKLGLSASDEKMKPNIDMQKINKDKSYKESIEKKVPIVKKHDHIPGSTAVIEKLSQFGEHKLWAMNHEQLKQYIADMLNLLDTKFDNSEIKDETKVSFASWRLRTGTKEAINREITYPGIRIKDALRDALTRLPHKISLIDYYVMHLFDISSREDIQKDISNLLADFQEKNQVNSKQQTDNLGSYGSYLRTRVMFAISNNWNILKDEEKTKLTGILYDYLSRWYVSLPTWHEKVAIYWLLSVTGINRDLGAVDNQYLDQEPECVQHAFAIFQCIQRNEEYLFRMDGEEFSSENVDYLKAVLHIFRLRKSKIDHKRKVFHREELYWIRWCWRILSKKESMSSNRSYQQFVLCLSKYCKEEIPVHGFRTLLSVTLDSSTDKYKNQFFYETLHFLDSIINDWIDYPIQKKHVDSFLEALEKMVNKQGEIVKYVCIRLKNLAWIKYYLFKNKNGMRKLPSEVFPGKQDEVKPSLLDWVSVSSSQALSQEAKLTHPLTENEVLATISQCMSLFEKKGLDFLHEYRLRNITITPKDWEKWRASVKEPLASNSTFPKLDSSSPIVKDLDPDWYYIHRIIDYVQSISTQEESDQFKACFVFAVILAELLSSRQLNASAFDLSNIMHWKGKQYVIEQCHGPSSEIIHLITDTINCFYLFYKHQYESLGRIKIPYRPYVSGEIIEVSRFKNIIENVRTASSRRYLSWTHGVLEVRVENIDSWIKDA